jgi:hypothetical protein
MNKNTGKCFLIVFYINNSYYIQLAELNGKYSLDAFNTIEDALLQFNSFKEKAKSSNYENHISGSIGIINLRPYIIEVERDNPESLRNYLIEDVAYTLKGGIFGASIDVVGVKVKEDILTLSVYDVAKRYIDEVYNIN